MLLVLIYSLSCTTFDDDHALTNIKDEWVIDEEERPQEVLEKETDLEEISDSKQEVVGV